MLRGLFHSLGSCAWPHRAFVSVFGVIVTAVLHILLLAPLVLGAGSHQRSPANDWSASAGVVSGDRPRADAMVLVMLSDSLAGAAGALADSDSDPILQDFPIQIATRLPSIPEIRFRTDDEEIDVQTSAEVEADQAAALSLLAGRYTGMVSARVERAWLRPRTPIGADRFNCQVRIEQDRAGGVQSVEIMACNGDSHWQESLVFAIERAAPLSAPPDPAVFAPQLILNFSALAYEEGVSREDEFEAVPRLATNQQ